MNKDLALKKEEMKMILLICGNPSTGKKSLVNSWMDDNKEESGSKSYYKVFNFTHEEIIDKTPITIPIEVRILNSEEIETELKINALYFKGALGAFVINSADEYITFQDGAKWKEKIDLMCCLPNKFPLPIFLIVNKCDKINLENPETKWMEKDKIEEYSQENQFFNHFLLSLDKLKEDNAQEKAREPLKEMIKVIFNFKDIKEKFLYPQGKMNDNDDRNKTIQVIDRSNEKKGCCIY